MYICMYIGIYMYVYVYVYMCVCMYTHTNTHTHTHIYIYTYTYTYMYIYIHTYTQKQRNKALTIHIYISTNARLCDDCVDGGPPRSNDAPHQLGRDVEPLHARHARRQRDCVHIKGLPKDQQVTRVRGLARDAVGGGGLVYICIHILIGR